MKIPLVVAGVMFVVLLALFAWPTLYRIDNLRVHGQETMVRTHRITGKSEYLSARYGWLEMGGGGAPAAQAPAPNPAGSPNEYDAAFGNKP